MRRGENRSTRRKTSRSKDENQQQTQPTYDAETGNRTRATLVGGERSHHCAIPAPEKHHIHDYVVKKGELYSKGEIDNKLALLKSEITTLIQTSMQTLEVKIIKRMMQFRNEQIKNRIQCKYLTIPKDPYKWLKLLHKSDVGEDVIDLKNVIILNIWIQRTN